MASETTQFGVHFMLDGYGADPKTLENRSTLTQLLTNIPASMDMHTISDPVVVQVGEKNTKDPGGISGFVMIAESHISFHTFPKRGFVSIDVYTCQNDLDTEKLTHLFKHAFCLDDIEAHVIARGTKYPTKNLH